MVKCYLGFRDTNRPSLFQTFDALINIKLRKRHVRGSKRGLKQSVVRFEIRMFLHL